MSWKILELVVSCRTCRELPNKHSDCEGSAIVIEHGIAEMRALKAKAIALQSAPERSFSCSLVEQSGGLLEF
jgi:hypothetical protein